MKKIISPVTRINGFWSLEVDIEGGTVVDARSSGIFFRGMELIMKDRDPRDAPYYTERICGICSTAHAIAAVTAVEDAAGITVPRNAILLRNLVFGADLIQNHLRHFYLLTLPDFAKGPDFPPFVPRYESDYRLSEAETGTLWDHYWEQVDVARKAHEMVTVFGGKIPHTHGITVGGATVPPTADNIRLFGSMLDEVSRFIDTRMVPDMELISRTYDDYFEIGKGYGNMITFGMFPLADDPERTEFPGGVIRAEDTIRPEDSGRGAAVVEDVDRSRITEDVTRSWYADQTGVHPFDETTEPDRTKENAYSWVKAPRYGGVPMETGPLARGWTSGRYRNGPSAMDRYVARVQEARQTASLMRKWLRELVPGEETSVKFDIPGEARGVGTVGAMRGALGHWVKIEGGRIRLYQVVTPSAWNCSPADERGMKGPVERALIGTPVKDPENPIEIGRVARSFDPCLACAVQVTLL